MRQKPFPFMRFYAMTGMRCQIESGCNVTVAQRPNNRWECMTCHLDDCEHVHAARDYLDSAYSEDRRVDNAKLVRAA